MDAVDVECVGSEGRPVHGSCWGICWHCGSSDARRHCFEREQDMVSEVPLSFPTGSIKGLIVPCSWMGAHHVVPDDKTVQLSTLHWSV